MYTFININTLIIRQKLALDLLIYINRTSIYACHNYGYSFILISGRDDYYF